MDWRHRARCRDVDPELFFPVGTTGPAEAQVQSAKAICALCPVREECLQWALDTAQDAGVWGGLSEEERRAAGCASPSAPNSEPPALSETWMTSCPGLRAQSTHLKPYDRHEQIVR
jgi:WhiB family redox-sensing transcriptional regulator